VVVPGVVDGVFGGAGRAVGGSGGVPRGGDGLAPYAAHAEDPGLGFGLGLQYRGSAQLRHTCRGRPVRAHRVLVGGGRLLDRAGRVAVQAGDRRPVGRAHPDVGLQLPVGTGDGLGVLGGGPAVGDGGELVGQFGADLFADAGLERLPDGVAMVVRVHVGLPGQGGRVGGVQARVQVTPLGRPVLQPVLAAVHPGLPEPEASGSGEVVRGCSAGGLVLPRPRGVDLLAQLGGAFGDPGGGGFGGQFRGLGRGAGGFQAGSGFGQSLRV
jgi:hypothetical protein